MLLEKKKTTFFNGLSVSGEAKVKEMLRKQWMRLLMATTVLFLGGCYDGNEVLQDLPVPSYDFSAIDQLLQDSLHIFNGDVVVLLQQDGRQIYSNAVGQLTAQDRLLVASASKIVSASVILSLADQGLLQVDDSIGTYLPVFTKHGKGQVTIRQCFTMTSGFQECGVSSGGCPVTNESLTLDEAVTRIAETQPLKYKPGTTVFYNSFGMQIAGRIAEIVSGKQWENLVKEQITGPCHMVSSDYGNTGLNPYIAGGLQTNVEDYINFLQMILNGGKFRGKTVLSSTAIQEYFTPQTLKAKRVESPYPFPPPFYPYEVDTVHYGFGSWQDVVNPFTGEIEQISSPGAFGMFPWVDRKRNIVGIIFTNSDLEKTIRTELKLISLVRKAVDQDQN